MAVEKNRVPCKSMIHKVADKKSYFVYFLFWLLLVLLLLLMLLYSTRQGSSILIERRRSIVGCSSPFRLASTRVKWILSSGVLSFGGVGARVLFLRSDWELK